MKNKLFKTVPALVLAATLAAGTFAFTACGDPEEKGPETQLPPGAQIEGLTDKPLEGEIFADYTKGSADAMHPTNGYTNGSPFNNFWTTDCVTYDGGVMKLHIKDNPTGSVEQFTEYYGGEERSYQNFGYGDYEVRMKPAKKTGTASTFFLYTGPSDTNPNTGEAHPWDEIDIEFLGKDTTQVQFNYFVNGVGGHEYMYDLGFDASEEFHNYGFRWEEDAITWFVDGEPVFKINGSENVPIPSHESKIIMNYWCGAPAGEAWMGKFENPDELAPEYEWIKVNSQPAWGEIPEKVEVEEFEGDWTTIDAISTTFDRSDNGVGTDYAITAAEDGKAATVTWTKAGNYDNVNFDVTEAAADKNWLHLVLENTGDEAITGRINIRNTEANATINQYGFGNGSELSTAIGEGTTVNLTAGQKMEIEIYYTDVADTVEIMLDSLQANAIDLAGSLKISDIKLAKQGDIVIPDRGDNQPVVINGESIKFANNAYVITTDTEANSIDVTYSGIGKESWQNISADVANIASTKNVFNATVTNNGEKAVKFRVDILAKNALPGAVTNPDADKPRHMACNLSATQDGQEAYTNLQWGGSEFTVAPGKTTKITVTYDTRYSPTQLQFLIDSIAGTASESNSGDITISEMSFTGEGAIDPDIGGSTTPEPPVTIPEGGNVDLTFGSTEVYTVDKNGQAADSVNVTYSAVTGATYKNISSTDAAQYANVAGIDTFTVTIKNNGTTAVTVRVDMIGSTAIATTGPNGESASTDVCNQSATATVGTPTTDLVYGGTTITVEAGQTTTLVLVFDNDGAWGAVQRVQFYFDSSTYGDTATHSGNVTISGFKFTSSTAAAE